MYNQQEIIEKGNNKNKKKHFYFKLKKITRERRGRERGVSLVVELR